jgi:hypothetical protein
MKSLWDTSYKLCRRLFRWLSNTHSQGLGTLLIGIAAVFALRQGSSLLDRVLQIQEQAKDIRQAVSELKTQTARISDAIDLLGSQIKSLRATQEIAASPALKSSSASKAELAQAIRSIPSAPSKDQAAVYLPDRKREATIESLYRANTTQERQIILQNSLEFRGQRRLQTEDGVDLTTEDGKQIITEPASQSKDRTH